jgi:hypothetical protein
MAGGGERKVRLASWVKSKASRQASRKGAEGRQGAKNQQVNICLCAFALNFAPLREPLRELFNEIYIPIKSPPC